MAVELDLSELLHSPGMRVPCDVDVPGTPELEMSCVSPVTGSLVFTNTGNVLVIQGEVTVTLKSACPRCLADVTCILDAEVDEEFSVSDGMITGRADDEEGMADPTMAVLVREGFYLNLTELVRQSLVLAGPVEPLCKEDCRGLCPQCGANLNEMTCACEPSRDSPLAALGELYKKQHGSSTA